ncbi:hypothetical protein Cabys_3353 [Caldithrix abyssi DSM 13497]|uniref:Uncharacterized protein n=1 Tax=Caldithrix abyssi DSM 13497 TaxID=880073 RepID=A0A1J1CBN4_CALAY|nr:hypothetical protein Cabys_3353 [Caldithrix abyssi DSM 13497]
MVARFFAAAALPWFVTETSFRSGLPINNLFSYIFTSCLHIHLTRAKNCLNFKKTIKR